MARKQLPISSGQVSLPTGDETYVYRAYCRCGDLLYVGIAGNLFDRFAGHRRKQAPWELRTIRIEWDLYATRRQAESVERNLIRTLHPSYNIIGRMKYGRPQWLPPLAPPPSLDHRALAAARRIGFVGDRV